MTYEDWITRQDRDQTTLAESDSMFTLDRSDEHHERREIKFTHHKRNHKVFADSTAKLKVDARKSGEWLGIELQETAPYVEGTRTTAIGVTLTKKNIIALRDLLNEEYPQEAE